MPRADIAPIAEAKGTGEPPRAPLRIMTQFLRAVSESRMEDALALSQTILTFEPRNAIILDYQATLAQYINNERELVAREGDAARDGGGGSQGSDDSTADDTSTGEESPSSSSDASTEEASGDDTPEGEPGATVAGSSNGNARGRFEKISRRGPEDDDQELQRLGGMLRDLRETRTTENMEMASRWDEEKFAASRREVEGILWKFLPDEAKQAAEKRGQDAADQQSRAHHK